MPVTVNHSLDTGPVKPFQQQSLIDESTPRMDHETLIGVPIAKK